MYSTCIYCSRPLGRNEAIEHFPVGRRLAYDPRKGRLWVVCRACERWNLTPVEERWEAIEEAERMYRVTRLRASTPNIGLARLRDGTDLVRVGEPLRPEFAAWRYGDQFGRRRRRQLAVTGGALVLVGGAVMGGAAIGLGGWVLWQLGQPLYRLAVEGRQGATIARLAANDGRVLHVQRSHLASTTLVRDDSGAPALSVQHASGQALFTGRDALRAASKLFPVANRYGGTRQDVEMAVARIEHAGDPARYFASLAATATSARHRARVARREWWRTADQPSTADGTGLFALPLSVRLAIEMVVHEEQERRALGGELAELERAWQEAEEIAAIADDMFLPAAVSEQLDRLRGRR